MINSNEPRSINSITSTINEIETLFHTIKDDNVSNETIMASVITKIFEMLDELKHIDYNPSYEPIKNKITKLIDDVKNNQYFNIKYCDEYYLNNHNKNEK